MRKNFWNMIDKLFEQFGEFMKNLNSDPFENRCSNYYSDLTKMPVWYYYVETYNVNGEEVNRVVKTNLDGKQSEKFVSDNTKSLRETIANKRSEMKRLAQEEKFEDALVLKNEIVDLESKLKESLEADQVEYEKNKSAKERLRELDAKLKTAVQNEEYETAAKIRDQIKSLNLPQ